MSARKIDTRKKSKVVRSNPALANVRQGWKEAKCGETKPVSDLWEGVNATEPANSLTFYRKTIRDLITYYAQFRPARGDVQIETIFDETNDHYELAYAGWNGPYRIHGSVLHIDIRNGKIWIQHDGTEEGIAEELVQAGIARDHIVLAFKPPEIRPHTNFAVA